MHRQLGESWPIAFCTGLDTTHRLSIYGRRRNSRISLLPANNCTHRRAPAGIGQQTRVLSRDFLVKSKLTSHYRGALHPKCWPTFTNTVDCITDKCVSACKKKN